MKPPGRRGSRVAERLAGKSGDDEQPLQGTLPLARQCRADGIGAGGEGVDDVVEKSHASYGGA